MRIGFLSLPVPGHLNPMTALARKLQSRGHDVVFISLADVAPFVESAGLPFVPVSETAYPAGAAARLARQLSELSGEEALHFTVNAMMKGYTASLFDSLPDTLSNARVDGLVLDQYQPYVELIPMHLRMPFVHVSNALHVDYTGRKNTPICFVGLAIRDRGRCAGQKHGGSPARQKTPRARHCGSPGIRKKGGALRRLE